MATIRPTDLLLNLKPSGIPKPYWDWIRRRTTRDARFAQRTAVALVVYTLATFGAFVWIYHVQAGLNRFMQGPPAEKWLLIVALPIQLGIAITQHVAMKRLKAALQRVVKADDAMLCTDCGYMLKGLLPEGRCPECGSRYDFIALQAIWEDTLNKL